MNRAHSHLDITQIFVDVDDFCQVFEPLLAGLLLPEVSGRCRPKSRLSLSEIMTVLIGFHGSGYRTFKDFYTLQVLSSWKSAMPNLVSYTRFVELMSWALLGLCCFLHSCRGEVTGLSFIDSTPLKVCHQKRASSHRVFADFAAWGKNAVGWYYGFKLHLIVNDYGELLAYKVTPANVDDRAVVPELTTHILGKVFGDKGYISEKLFHQLYARGVQLITKLKKNMKNKLMPINDKLVLQRRGMIESVNAQLKHQCQIEHSRHRSVLNFMVNLMAGLVAYCYLPTKASLHNQPVLPVYSF